MDVRSVESACRVRKHGVNLAGFRGEIGPCYHLAAIVAGHFVKQTVDRYIDEFERLLDEVSRDDRGQVVARTYLTSETGKVYTMLAHAAGRFD